MSIWRFHMSKKLCRIDTSEDQPKHDQDIDVEKLQ